MSANAAWQSPLNPPAGSPGAAHTPESIAAVYTEMTALHTLPVSRPLVSSRSMNADAVLNAFLDVREGRSNDFVAVSPEMNALFLNRARELGAVGSDASLNRALMNVRKSGKLRHYPTTAEYVLPATAVPFQFVAEWAARHVQRTVLLESGVQLTLDDLLCDPAVAGRFDLVAARLRSAITSIDHRWGALAIRKTSRVKPAQDAVHYELSERMIIGAGERAPDHAGILAVCTDTQALYVGSAVSLRAQIGYLFEVGGRYLVPDWLWPSSSVPEYVKFVALPGASATRLNEARIDQIARLRPWLNLVEMPNTRP